MVARVEEALVGGARGRGDGAADGLDEEARDVKGDEDDGVPLGAEAGEGRVQRGAQVLEGEVDGDAD